MRNGVSLMSLVNPMTLMGLAFAFACSATVGAATGFVVGLAAKWFKPAEIQQKWIKNE